MHLLVLRSGDEPRRRLSLVDGATAMDNRTARLRLWLRPQRFRAGLRMIKAAAAAVDAVAIVGGKKFGSQHGSRAIAALGLPAHALAPLSIWAMWMNLMGTPMRSAQPR